MKTIKIKDYYGIYQEIPVSDELYEEWRALQNETQRIHRKEVYHRDWTPMDDLEASVCSWMICQSVRLQGGKAAI